MVSNQVRPCKSCEATGISNVNGIRLTPNLTTIFTVKIATDLVCAQRRYPCNTSGFRRQCYSSPQGTHLPIYANLLWFSVAFAMFRRSGPLWNFCAPPTSPSATRASFPYLCLTTLCPPQNLASHNLVSRGQSVVVLTVKMVYYYNYDDLNF